ncbi:MAG: serine/threonine-protein kinase [Polyangiaceae bacterium]
MPEAVGRFRPLFALGTGGMGTVYAARVGTGDAARMVALKVMRRDSSRSAQSAFLREGRIATRIHHPNVVWSYELGTADGRPYISMELVFGVSLAELVQKLRAAQARLDPYLAAFVVAAVADGLHAAHDLTDDDGAPLGLVHRDVSPHNVLLGFDGRVLVSDFGIAKVDHGATTTTEGVVKGKLAYMSPEQVSGEALDRRSDVFALGVLLHELLTGHRLFLGETPAAVAMAVANRRVEPPADAPTELTAVTMRCLEKTPDRRFGTASEVAEALRVAMGAHAVDAAALARELEARCADTRAEITAKLEAARVMEGDAEAPAEPRRRGVVLGAVVVLVALATAFFAARMSETREASRSIESIDAAPRATVSVVASTTTAPVTTPSSPPAAPIATAAAAPETRPGTPRARPGAPRPPAPVGSGVFRSLE